MGHFLYTEDGLARTQGSKCRETFMLMFLIFETFGFPVAWHKVKAGTRLEWIGYQLDGSSFDVGISDRKKEWLLSWLDGRPREGGAGGRNLRSLGIRQRRADPHVSRAGALFASMLFQEGAAWLEGSAHVSMTGVTATQLKQRFRVSRIMGLTLA